MHPNVIGLGTAAIDIVLNCDTLPREDGFSMVHTEQMIPGGSCANVLGALAILGHSPALIAKLGDDHLSSVFVADLKKNRIGTDYIQENPNGTMLHTYITVAEAGKKSIFVNLGDSLLALSEDDVQLNWLDRVSVFYTDMFPAEPALKLARECLKRGIQVVFNLQTSVPFMEMCGITQDQIREMIGLSNLFITSREGLLAFDSLSDPLSACKNICRTYRNREGVIVTLGKKGVIWAGNDFSITAPAFDVDSVDTTGAGDAFSGGIIHSFLLRQQTREHSVKFAQACAAIKCTIPGPRFKASHSAVTDLIHRQATGDSGPENM